MPSSPRWTAAADDDHDATCDAISHGSLMGARGNSGVILSQIMRGLRRHGQGARRRPGRQVRRGAARLRRPARTTPCSSRSRERSSPCVARAPRRPRSPPTPAGRSSRSPARRVRPASSRSTTPPSSSRCSRMPASSTPAAPGSCCCSTRCCYVVDGEPLPIAEPDDGTDGRGRRGVRGRSRIAMRTRPANST